MATVYITELDVLASPGGSMTQMPYLPKQAAQTVAIGGSSTQSAAFGSSTNGIRVHADAICSVEIGGKNPAATTSSQRMAANQTEYFQVNPGDKLAVITNT